jgi:hypothetical protein
MTNMAPLGAPQPVRAIVQSTETRTTKTNVLREFFLLLAYDEAQHKQNKTAHKMTDDKPSGQQQQQQPPPYDLRVALQRVTTHMTTMG